MVKISKWLILTISFSILLFSISLILWYYLKTPEIYKDSYKHISLTQWMKEETKNPGITTLFQVDLIHNQILVETTNKGSFMIDATHPTLISALQIKSDGTYVLDAFNNIVSKDGVMITQIKDIIKNHHKLGMYIFLYLLSIISMASFAFSLKIFQKYK